jgi:hypothetical protein
MSDLFDLSIFLFGAEFDLSRESEGRSGWLLIRVEASARKATAAAAEVHDPS